MTQWPTKHFTADDLDAFHSASLSVEARQHLDECPECRALALSDHALLTAMAKLPSLEPAAGFADRVMARIERPDALPVRVFQRRRLALAASLIFGLGASIGWSLFNRTLLLSWLNEAAASIGNTVWVGVRVVATNLSAQPWFGALREFASSSGRLAVAGAVLLVAYGAALFALRRLLIPPSRPVPYVNG